MSLSDHPDRKKLESRPRRSVVAATKKRWSDSQKIEAVTTHMALGSRALTSAVLSIPDYTLRDWMRSAWWKEIADELRVQEDIQLSSRLKKIIDSSLTATEDRLKNGDWIYNNKTGELIRKPPNLRDVHRVSMDLVTKKHELEGRNQTSVPLEAIENKLKKLAESMTELANKTKKPQIEVTDVVFGEVIEDAEEVLEAD